MVSPLANESFAWVTFLSAPTAPPRLAPDTATAAGAGAGAGAVVGAGTGAGAGGASFLHAARPTATSASVRSLRVLFMDAPCLSGFRGDLELLSREDLVGILEDVAVGFVDRVPR